MKVEKSLFSLLKQYESWLDAGAILAWGFLLINYWMTGKLYILIHPRYFGLTVSAGIFLLILGGWKIFELWNIRKKSRFSSKSKPEVSPIENQHINFFPPGWSSVLLLISAILALTITPQVFASQTALQRGLTESLPVTRTQPQEFRTATKPEERSLIEWIRTLNVYPEPDAYNGQKVEVTGFVIYPRGLSEQYFWISRFILTCCAADAYPVGLPVKLPEGKSRSEYPQDGWFRVTGKMITEELNAQRKLTISPIKIESIPKPKNPYDY
ncbi:MAG: TIGR03943 family protein [Okeania sp. SIO3I5]|uniref:TIGR03943 family putative permease subunit n=1 Tax=Okeania sp. SIO3I5 TaxID=2607805 RepID=UPI0013BABE07|nr:TIGR03943 family protein [Okeania sp. SIO3I5]NEQ40332.1 TIGR03943 family protein [Okeania sp. SIO3I5]